MNEEWMKVWSGFSISMPCFEDIPAEYTFFKTFLSVFIFSGALKSFVNYSKTYEIGLFLFL